MSQDTNINNLIINKLTKAQFDNIENPDTTQIYLITDDNGITTLDDININNLTNGQILQYDSAIKKWKNVGLPTVDQTFDGTSQNAQSGVAVNDALTGGTVSPVFNEQIMFANQTSIQSFTDEVEGINVLSLSANVVEAASDYISLNGEIHIGNGYIRSYQQDGEIL